MNVLGDKVISMFEAYLLSQEPQIQALIIGELEVLAKKFITFAESKVHGNNVTPVVAPIGESNHG